MAHTVTVHVEDQPDHTFAVYIEGDDDPEGAYDRIFSWGHVDGNRVRKADAKKAAEKYAAEIERLFNQKSTT